jgi:hypothetical protein
MWLSFFQLTRVGTTPTRNVYGHSVACIYGIFTDMQLMSLLTQEGNLVHIP